MEPTIRSGDLLLIDLSQTNVRKDSIYVLRIDELLVSKRLQWMYDGSLVIRSDNPAYGDQVIAAGNEYETTALEIIGRVIWFGRCI